MAASTAAAPGVPAQASKGVDPGTSGNVNNSHTNNDNYNIHGFQLMVR